MGRAADGYAILVIDDDPDICQFIADVAEDLGLHVDIASNYQAFLQQYQDRDHAALVLDLQMPDKDGLEYLRLLSETGFSRHVLLMSGYDDRVLKTAQRVGRSEGLKMLPPLPKPIEISDLKQRLRSLTVPGERIARNELEKALAEQELFLEFQPKVRLDPSSGATTGTILSVPSGDWMLDSFEALIRWQHPTLGRVPPDRFIHLAERWGLIQALTEQVVERALNQLRDWQDNGLELTVAVNYPPQMLEDMEAPDRLASRVREAGFSTDRIIVEVTETAAMTDIGRSMDVLSRLRLKGFRLAMDDFGTGYSSLVQLHRMPFTELKIDKSIVLDMSNEREAHTIVRAIVELAHNLDLEVCAEGAEDAKIVEELRRFGCDVAQGYLIATPLGAHDVMRLTSTTAQRRAARK